MKGSLLDSQATPDNFLQEIAALRKRLQVLERAVGLPSASTTVSGIVELTTFTGAPEVTDGLAVNAADAPVIPAANRVVRLDSAGDLIITGDVSFGGDLKPVRGATYTGYIVVPLATNLTSTAWNGDAKGAGDSGTLDLSAVFGAPAGIKGVFLYTQIYSAAAARRMILSRASDVGIGIVNRAQVVNQFVERSGFVTCDANGDIYISIDADLAQVRIEITAYLP